MSILALCTLALTLSPVDDTQLLVFSSPQCPPCRQMAPIVDSLSSAGYPVNKIDATLDPSTASRFGVTGVPCFIMLSGGQVVGRIDGATSMDSLLHLFKSAGYASPQASRQTTPVDPDRLPVNQRGSTYGGDTSQPFQTGGVRPVEYSSPNSNGGYVDAPLKSGQEIPSQPTEAVVNLTPAMQRAMAATVRLRVHDQIGIGVGTGTIIHQQGEEALILTCGHLFRESKGNARIEVEYGFPSRSHVVEGKLLDFDADDHDTALVVFRPGGPVEVAQVALPSYVPLRSDQIFSVGCDRGSDPTVRASRIKALTQYSSVIKYDIFGRPVDGRSGGGLFTAGGQLIGVCNAAAVEVDEGIFAGMDSLYRQLDAVGMAQYFEDPSRLRPNDDRQLIVGKDNGHATPQSLAPVQSVENLANTSTPQVTPSIDATLVQQSQPYPSDGNGSEFEMIVLVRSKADPSRMEWVVIDNPSPAMLEAVQREGGGVNQQRGVDPSRSYHSTDTRVLPVSNGMQTDRTNINWDSIQPPVSGPQHRAQSPR